MKTSAFLLSLLPSFRKFNDKQKFLAPMEILKIMRHVKLQQNLDTYSSCSFSTFSNSYSFLPNSSHFSSNPLNPQPLTSMQNSEILPGACPVTQSRLKGHQLPQLSSSVPALSPVTHLSCQVKMGVSSVLPVGSTAHL